MHETSDKLEINLYATSIKGKYIQYILNIEFVFYFIALMKVLIFILLATALHNNCTNEIDFWES
jgi:hypothetical protein